jgi:hypothetical protein
VWVLAAYHHGVCSTQGDEQEQRFCGFRHCFWSCGEALCDEVGRQLRRVAGWGASRQRAPLTQNQRRCVHTHRWA